MKRSTNIFNASKPIIAFLLKLTFVYVTLLALRLQFVFHNSEMLGEITAAEIPDMLKGIIMFDNANICYTFMIFILLSILPLSQNILRKKWYKTATMWSYLIGYFFILLTNIGDSVYFSYSRKRFTAEDFHFFENDNTGEIVLKAFAENWPLTLSIIVMMFVAFWVYRKIDSITKTKYTLTPRTHYACKILILPIAIMLIILGMRGGGLGKGTQPIRANNAAQFTTQAIKASIIPSNPFCILRTIGDKPFEKMVFFDDSIALKHFNPIISAKRDSLFGSQKGKNLVIIVMESFSSQHSALLSPQLFNGDPGFTPFLDSLMQQGYYYTQSFSNGQKSIEALPSILSSIPSLGRSFAITPEAFSPMDGMGTYFNDLGYNTSFYNGSESGSMGFSAFARTAGIQIIKSREDFEEIHGPDLYDGYWGIWDEEFLQYYASDLTKEYEAAKKPFFSTLFTISSHHPFAIPERYEGDFHKLTHDLQRAVEYSDMAMRKFFDTAKQQPWYDNTVFIVIADHDCGDMFGTRTATQRNGIIHFIYTPDASLHGRNDNITQHINIKPTIFQLFGYEKPFFSFGRSDFDNPKPYNINTNSGFYQWLTEEQVIITAEGELKSVYNYKKDTSLLNNLAPMVNVSDFERLKGFQQAYSNAIERQNFSATKK